MAVHNTHNYGRQSYDLLPSMKIIKEENLHKASEENVRRLAKWLDLEVDNKSKQDIIEDMRQHRYLMPLRTGWGEVPTGFRGRVV